MMPTLITIPFSHFCEKARWSLETAGVAFREEGHCPVLHRLAVRRAGGRGSVPALVIEGGRPLDDSPLIVQYADAQAAPGRKLLPVDGSAREEALAIERELGDEFAPHVRRFVYFHVLPRREQALELFRADVSATERAIVRFAFPAMRAVMKRVMRIDDKGMERSRDAIRRVLDAMGARLRDGRPYLLGDRFSAVDIAFAAFASPIVLPQEHPKLRVAFESLTGPLADEIGASRQHPAGLFALRMYRERRGELPAS